MKKININGNIYTISEGAMTAIFYGILAGVALVFWMATAAIK